MWLLVKGLGWLFLRLFFDFVQSIAFLVTLCFWEKSLFNWRVFFRRETCQGGGKGYGSFGTISPFIQLSQVMCNKNFVRELAPSNARLKVYRETT